MWRECAVAKPSKKRMDSLESQERENNTADGRLLVIYIYDYIDTLVVVDIQRTGALLYVFQSD